MNRARDDREALARALESVSKPLRPARDVMPSTCGRCGVRTLLVVTKHEKFIRVDWSSVDQNNLSKLEWVGKTPKFKHQEHVPHFTTCKAMERNQ